MQVQVVLHYLVLRHHHVYVAYHHQDVNVAYHRHVYASLDLLVPQVHDLPCVRLIVPTYLWHYAYCLVLNRAFLLLFPSLL